MARAQAKYIIDEKGKKSAVIHPIEEYNELLEDIHDPAVSLSGKKRTPPYHLPD